MKEKNILNRRKKKSLRIMNSYFCNLIHNYYYYYYFFVIESNIFEYMNFFQYDNYPFLVIDLKIVYVFIKKIYIYT